MNDALVKQIIKCKLNMARRIVDQLPAGIAGEIRHACSIAMECRCENLPKATANTGEKKPSKELEHVTIE